MKKPNQKAYVQNQGTLMIKLSSSTPTGTQTVSYNDDVLKFDLCADGKDSPDIKMILLNFRSTTKSLNKKAGALKTIKDATGIPGIE